MLVLVVSVMTELLIPRLYDAVGDPDEWGAILDEVVLRFSQIGASIFSGDEVQIELNHVFMSSMLSKNVPMYLANGFNEVDMQSYPAVRAVGKKLQFESEYDLYHRAEQAGFESPVGIEKLRSWLRSIGIQERSISVLEASPGSWSFMAFHSGRRLPATHIASTSALLRHVAKIVRINRPFLLLNNRFNAVFEVIDRFHLGVLVLDSANRIVLANSAADSILDTADGIRRGRGQELRGCVEQSSKNLAAAIAGLNSHSGAVEFSIPRLTDKIDYVAEVSLLSSRVLDSSADYRLLVITDPERDDIVNLSGIRKIYQLSNAEKDVAERIVTGTSYKQIAEMRGVSPETVKVQVASILRKTGCKNRTELVCLAHRASIPVDQL